MRRISTGLALTGLLFGFSWNAPVWAQDSSSVTVVTPGSSDQQAPVIITQDNNGQQGNQPGTTDYTGTSVAEEKPVSTGTFSDEVLGVIPQVGAIVFTDPLGNTTSRAAGGLTFDWNLAGTADGNPRWFIGPSTGAIYSHLGSATSNFFGTDPTSAVNNPGAQLLIIPANLKIGYNFGNAFRVSGHGGGNVVYRSANDAVNLGSANSGGGIPKWNIFPNVGGDLEIILNRAMAFTLRPDLTITPGNNIFTGTAGFTLAVG